MGETIAILSLKGGVGKTSSVVSLGSALAEFGKKVLLVDANFSAPNLGIHLNILNPLKTIHEVMERNIHPQEAVNKLENFDVIPASIYSNGVNNPLRLKYILKSIKKSYDYILIDSSPSLNEETLAAMLASDRLFVVTTPDYSTLGMTLKALNLAKKRGIKVDGLILNKVYSKDFELSLKNIENTTETPILAVIPHDLNIPEAQSKFMPLNRLSPNSQSNEEYKKLAAAIIGQEYQPSGIINFFRAIFPKKQELNRIIYYKGIFGN